MPKRPPKRWFKSCVEGVEEGGYAEEPKAVCGDLWYNKLTEADRKRITREEEKKKRKRKKK